MGAVCCVAVKDRSITRGPAGDALQSRNFRWDWENRGRVAGEETSVNWLNDGDRYNDKVDGKFVASNWLSVGVRYNDKVDDKFVSARQTSFASQEGSPLDSLRPVRWQKSPASQKISEPSKLLASGPSHKEAEEGTSPRKLSPSTPSVSSFSSSPSSSKGHPLPTGSTPRWSRVSPSRRPLRQVSDSRVPEFRSPTLSNSEEASSVALPCGSNVSTRGSNGGSSERWSIPAFSGLPTSHKETWSVDSESLGFVRDKIKISSGLSSRSLSFDLPSCGICTKLLSEKSSFGIQNIISTNELTVSAVLPCAHVYHAECIESMSSEVNKYEPLCPICTFGEKQALKISEKVSKAEMDLRNRRSSLVKHS